MAARRRSCAGRKPVLTAILSGKAQNTLVIGDQRPGNLDRASDEKPVGRIAVLELVQAIDADRTQTNGSAALLVDQSTRRWSQGLVAAVEPERDMRVEEQAIRHRSISRPVAASGSTSRAGAISSKPSGIRTDPR